MKRAVSASHHLGLLSLFTVIAIALVFTPGILVGRAASVAFGACGDPRAAIFCSSLVSGQLGAWDMDGGAPITNPTVHGEISSGLGLNLVRYQMWRQPCALSTADISNPGTTCVTTTEFGQVINGIHNVGAEPLIDLPPIVNTCEHAAHGGPTCNRSGSIKNDNQCAKGPSDQAESLAWDEWIIAQAGTAAELYELGNEPDNYCGMTISDYHNLWSSTVPALKSYARGLTTGGCPCTIFVGGPAWTNSNSSTRTAIDTFLADVLSDYSGHGENLDYIPDFISTHTYLTSAQNDTEAHATAAIAVWGTFYDNLQADIAGTFSGVTLDGVPATAYIKVADSEYNDTINTGSQINTSQSWCDFYYGAMFSMFNSHGVWIDNQFTLAATGEGALNLVDPSTAIEAPCFSSFANRT